MDVLNPKRQRNGIHTNDPSLQESIAIMINDFRAFWEEGVAATTSEQAKQPATIMSPVVQRI